MVVQAPGTAPRDDPMSIHDNAHRMVAEGMQFSWCWSAGTILLNVEVVWEMSDQTATEDNHSNGDEIWV